MEAKAEKYDDIVIVNLSGRLDYESADKFCKICLSDIVRSKVVFNLSDLKFIGSNGVLPFVQAISSLSLQTKSGLKLCSVSVEFKKLFESSTIGNLEFYESLESACGSFDFTHKD